MVGSWEVDRWRDREYVKDFMSSDRARDARRLPMLRLLARLIPFEQDSAIRVLDVGAGYGVLTQVLLETFPNAEVVWHDFSEPMLEAAQLRLKDFLPRIHWVKSDLSSPEWTGSLAGHFHAVVSSIAIHNLPSPQRIRQVYSEIFPLVAGGGCFLNAEAVGPSGEAIALLYQRERIRAEQERWKRENGMGKSLDDIEAELRQTHSDCFEPSKLPSLEQHMSWLREAGFDEVDCFSKEMWSAILVGYRSR